MASIDAQLRFSAGLSRIDVNGGRNLRLRLRRDIGKWLEDYIRTRVQQNGEGAYGKLQNYSKNPLLMLLPRDPSLKPIIPPRGGIKSRHGMLFVGGYEEYKQLTGQVWDKFTLTNKGNLWRDWQYFERNSLTTPIELGFSDPRNTMVAEVERTIHDRPGIFALDSKGRRRLNKFIETWLKQNF